MPTVLESLNNALHHSLAYDQRVIILGEDILDPYGGAFKVTKGLSTAFPERVFATPVSEAGFTGVAAGMALRGLRPVVEIMFGDFVTLIADQLINHIVKFSTMYNQHVSIPMVIRTPMGGRRGYGPTHSQSLEKLFLGIPGLRIIAPSHLCDPGWLLSYAILNDNYPVLFVENKLLYLLEDVDPNTLTDYSVTQSSESNLVDRHTQVMSSESSVKPEPSLSSKSYAPSLTIKIKHAPDPEITLAAYSYSSELALKAIKLLAYQYEIFAELVIVTQLTPIEFEPILVSVSRTGRLLVIEEATLTSSWSSEVVARIAESLGPRLRVASRLAGRDLLIPASPSLESSVLPDVMDIVQSVRKLV